jgi:hypothetical protein
MEIRLDPFHRTTIQRNPAEHDDAVHPKDELSTSPEKSEDPYDLDVQITQKETKPQEMTLTKTNCQTCGNCGFIKQRTNCRDCG